MVGPSGGNEGWIGVHADHDVAPGGQLGTDRGYRLEDFDTDLTAAGFELEHRFATWDLRPWHARADFAVSVLRRP